MRKNVKVGGEPLAIEHQYLVTKDGSSVLMSRDGIVAMTSCSVLIWNSAVIESLIFDVKQQQTMLKENGSTVLMSRDDIVAMKSCSVLIRNSAAIESQIFDLKQQQSMLKENAS